MVPSLSLIQAFFESARVTSNFSLRTSHTLLTSINHASDQTLVCFFITSFDLSTICQPKHLTTPQTAFTPISIQPRGTAIIAPRSARNVSSSIFYWFLLTDQTVRISFQCVLDLQAIPRPAMPPACSLLGMATPAPPEIQPFRFFDLPIEIRYMVYDLLKDRRVPVTVPGLELPGCVYAAWTEVLECFHPAMLRVNKQLANEYAALVMPKTILLTNWRTCDHDTPHERTQSNQAQPSTLPDTTLASLQYLVLRILMDTSTTHCGKRWLLDFNSPWILTFDVQRSNPQFGH